MIEDLIKEITKEVKNKYPQVEVPGAMKAKIISVKKQRIHIYRMCS